MEKTLQKHIEELLHLYDEARTTDAQERELADFFSQPHDDLPEEWEKYTVLFTTFANCDSLFSEAELEEMTTPLPHRSRRVWTWTLGAAATIALLIGFFLHQPQPTKSPDYLAIAEQPIQSIEELVITAVDSALMGRIAGLDIVSNSAEMGDPEDIVQLGESPIATSDYYFGVSKPEDNIELRIEQDMLLTFNDRMLYGRKAGGGGEGVRVQIPTNYKVGDSLQTLSTEDTIQINSTYKDDVVFGTLQLGRRESLQTWEHRNSGYNWDITPYQEYQENLLKRLGISITFPESTVRYFSHLGEMEDYAFFTFGTADASRSWTHFNGRMFVQMSPSFCIILYDTGNYDYPHAFENREYMVSTEELTIDTEVAYFDHLIRNNLDIPWTGWYDYSGEDLQKLQEWDGANYILKFKDAAWVKHSNAEVGFVAKIPNFERIQYNGEELSENNIGSYYNACYGVELSRLYNPESILMLFFINTEKEKDILKCLEEACKYVSFDNSYIKEAPTREDTDINILAPDTTTLELSPSDRMLYGRKVG